MLNYKDIETIIDGYPFLNKKTTQSNFKEAIVYSVTTKMPDYDGSDLPYENEANIIELSNGSITCRHLAHMYGLLYAREELPEIKTKSQLLQYLKETQDLYNSFMKEYKRKLVEVKLKQIKEDFQ